MRFVRLAVATALFLGLISHNSAFLLGPNRPTHVLVPSHKLRAVCNNYVARSAGSRSRTHGARFMSTVVETDSLISSPEPSAESSPEASSEPAVAENTESEATSAPEEPKDPKIKLADLVSGQEYSGKVNNVVPYGAFVDIGAEVNGLVHISQLSDTFVANPADVISDGQDVTVKVMEVDVEKKKLVLTMRKAPRPRQTQNTDLSQYTKILQEDPGRFMPAKVDSIVSYGAFVSLEGGSTGFLHISQLKPKGTRTETVTDVLQVGQEVQVRIRSVDEDTQRLNLSLVSAEDEDTASTRGGVKRATSETKDVSKLVGLEKDVVRKGVVSAVMDYGLFVTIEGVDGLLHISKMREDRSMTAEMLRSDYQLGQEVDVRILAVDTDRNKLSLTMLAGDSDDRPQRKDARESGKRGDMKPFMDLPPTEWIEGTVASIVDYGAFVTLADGVDGLVHVSEMGESRVEDPRDAVEAGQLVKVRIISIDPESRRVKLSMKEYDPDAKPAEDRPAQRRQRNAPRVKDVSKWLGADPEEWFEGTVSSITSFGAFVTLDEQADGLLHISRIADQRVEEVSDVLQEGQTVRVRIVDVDVQANRIALSMREPRAPDSNRGGGGFSRGGRQPRGDVGQFADIDPDTFITGTVSSTLSYGAFVKIAEGVEGLLHISRLAEGRVDDVEEVVQVGQEIQVRVLAVDTAAGTVNLTALSPEAQARKDNNRGGGRGGQSMGGDEEGGQRRSSRSSEPRTTGSGEQDWKKYLNQYFDDEPPQQQ